MYSTIYHTWVIAPPTYMVLFLTIIAFILGAIGLKDKTNWLARVRSWLTVSGSLLLSVLLFFAIFFTTIFSMEKELIKTTHAPDDNYTIDFYQIDRGAATSIGVMGELNGPLWF